MNFLCEHFFFALELLISVSEELHAFLHSDSTGFVTAFAFLGSLELLVLLHELLDIRVLLVY